uniref:PCI domain-containing protein n=1 Tax=Glycine max TaxID=3847 RepID=A0A0R0F443_SOYBN
MEKKQSEVMEQLVKQASASPNANALTSILVQATSHPNVFSFSQFLALPNLLQLEATENSTYLDMLRLFAHGTWSDYKSNADCFPQLIPDQILKLKQLTVLTLAETYKVLPYNQLMQELDMTNVRELEDFLISECMYSVQFAACRDLRHAQLGSMIQTLSNWLSTSENLLVSIQEKIKWADAMSEIEKKHRKDVEEKVQEVKSLIKEAENTILNIVIDEDAHWMGNLVALAYLIFTWHAATDNTAFGSHRY